MPSWRYFDEYNADTDWLSTVTKDAWIFDNSFSMSGGGEKATYRFSLSYMNEGGTTIGTGLDRIKANYNLTYRFSDKFDMYAEFSYTDTQKDEPYTDELRAEAMRKVLERGTMWLSRGASVSMFPEGTRSKDGEIHRFKAGAFSLAREAGVAILPVVMDGTRSMFRSTMLFNWHNTFKVNVLPEVSAEEVVSLEQHELMERVRTQMVDALAEMRRNDR